LFLFWSSSIGVSCSTSQISDPLSVSFKETTMAQRTIPDTGAARDARFNQLTVERFRADAQAALQHSTFRNDRVVRVLCFIDLLRGLGRIRNTAKVDCIAAQRQHFSSTSGYQAAHYLPGQIRIDGSYPWNLIQDARTRLQFEVLFADVEHLPADFNKADSAAESCGLKDAFARSCQAVVWRNVQRPAGELDRQAVREVYQQIWRPAAEQAFRVAMQQKHSRPHLPELRKDEWGNILNLEERGNATEAEWRIEVQMNILRHYLNSMQTPPPALSDPKMSQFEREFRP
jgi:hypothetical protein